MYNIGKISVFVDDTKLYGSFLYVCLLVLYGCKNKKVNIVFGFCVYFVVVYIIFLKIHIM